MSIGVADFHFVCPWVVSGRVKNRGFAFHVLLVEDCYVLDTYPYPSARMALVTLTQVDSGIVAADVREIVSAPIRVRETQDIDVVSKAARHIRDAQNWFCMLKSCSAHWTILLLALMLIKLQKHLLAACSPTVILRTATG